jgi:hypothetical protein
MTTRATNPAPRRRATNVQAAPAMPVYEIEARRFARANIQKNAAAKIEKESKLQCHKAMLAAKISTFTFEEGGKTFDAIIEGGQTETINVRKLYAKIAAGEITLDQFLEAVSAPMTSVKRVCGTNVMAGCIDTTPKEADLSIKARR